MPSGGGEGRRREKRDQRPIKEINKKGKPRKLQKECDLSAEIGKKAHSPEKKKEKNRRGHEIKERSFFARQKKTPRI